MVDFFFLCILYRAYCCLYVKTNGEPWIYPSLHYNFGSFHRLLESGGSILPMGNGGSILLCTIILAISTGCWGAVDPFSCLLYCAHCCLYALWPMENGGSIPSFYRLLESGGSILLCTEVYLLIPVSGLGKRIAGKCHKPIYKTTSDGSNNFKLCSEKLYFDFLQYYLYSI
jgi:hypothetical protein